MLYGFMDHWVPSSDDVSMFWKTPMRELRPLMEKLCDEIDFNNFTVYTKWYSNGINSTLPFLRNHPLAQNTITENGFGREWLNFFHERGITVGAMLQCYTFEPGAMPRDAILGSWAGSHKCTGLAGDDEVVNPLWEGYPDVLEKMLEEELLLFPDLDGIFLEFEGLGGPPVGHALWQLAHSEGDIQSLISPRVRQHWEDSDAGGGADPWLWTTPVQNALKQALRKHLDVAQRVMDRLGFKGIRAVVYHAYGYEIPYILDTLPDRNWWLMPWNYWGWDWCRNHPDEKVHKQIDFCKKLWAKNVADGYKLCYIGNGTMKTNRPETVTDLFRYCQQINAAGYIGMGNPIPKYGMRWFEANDESVAKMRDMFRQLLPKK